MLKKLIAHSVIIVVFLLGTFWGTKGYWHSSGLGCKSTFPFLREIIISAFARNSTSLANTLFLLTM